MLSLHRTYLAVLGTAVAWSAATIPALAQESASPPQSGGTNGTNRLDTGIADIVVTAERRSTSLQKTPVAVTALSQQDLSRAQVRTLGDMQALVPSFKMGESAGIAQITIRGVGIASFSPTSDAVVAVNLNDVVVSRPMAQAAGIFDVANVEVLRGPQGTLYGRNATAGSVNIHTNLPGDTLSGYARATVGNYNTGNFEGAVGGPLVSDTVRLRLAVFTQNHSGYGKNIVTGNDIDDKHSVGGRATLLVRPADHLTATAIVEYFHENDNGGANHVFGISGTSGLPGATGTPSAGLRNGGYLPTDIRNIAAASDPHFKLDTFAATGILEWKADDLTLKSITGYRHQTSYIQADLSGGSNPAGMYVAGEPAHQISQEVQANYSTNRLNATVGAFYFSERAEDYPANAIYYSDFLGIPGPSYLVERFRYIGYIDTRAYAFFGQATYHLTDALSLTAGVRYSDERKRRAQDIEISASKLYAPYPFVTTSPVSEASFHAVTPRFGIQYQIAPRTMLYVIYAKGFKSGGFDVTAATPAFKPEKITDYEGGIKTTLLDGHLRANLAAFRYDYTDLQVLQLVNQSPTTTNAASARVTGAEAEITLQPLAGVQLDGSVSWLHARFLNYTAIDPSRPLIATFNYSGNSMLNAPDISGRVGAQYTLGVRHGSLIGRAETEFTSTFYFAPSNLPYVTQGAFAKINLSLAYERDDHWRASLFVRNLTNRTTKTSTFVGSATFGGPLNGSLAAPRTFGAEVGYSF